MLWGVWDYDRRLLVGIPTTPRPLTRMNRDLLALCRHLPNWIRLKLLGLDCNSTLTGDLDQRQLPQFLFNRLSVGDVFMARQPQ